MSLLVRISPESCGVIGGCSCGDNTVYVYDDIGNCIVSTELDWGSDPSI